MAIALQYSLSAANAKGLSEYAASKGVDIAPLAKSLNLDTQAFGDSSSRLDLQAYAKLLDLLATITGDDCFGLNLGEAYVMGDISPIGLAIINAPTLGDAIECYHKYLPLITDTPFFDKSQDSGATIISFRYWPLVVKTADLVDFRMILICRTMRLFLGANWLAPEAHLFRAPPRSCVQHRKLLSNNLTFGANLNSISFPTSLLTTPNSIGDPRLFALLVEACERQLAQALEQSDLIQRVKRFILSRLPTNEVTLENLANQLGLGERTLQRRLREQDTTLADLVEMTKRELSDKLLSENQLPLEEISFLCGYSSAAAYSRAANKWYGMPPVKYRNSLIIDSN